MKAQLETLLARLFPVRLPTIEGIIIERKRTDRSRQYPALLPGEDGIGRLIEHEYRPIFSNGIERMQFQQDYERFLAEGLDNAFGKTDDAR